MKYVFIIGCPRSGSTWTSFLLAQHQKVATLQHLKLFDYLIRMDQWHERKANYAFTIDPLSKEQTKDYNLRLSETMPLERFHGMLGDFAKSILNFAGEIRPGVEMIVDKTPENCHHADFILDTIPDAYFLHIIRDPRSTFCSHRSAAETWAKWDFPSKSNDGARYWKHDVEVSLDVKNKTERYHEVRYEDLKDNGPTELAKILSWLELDGDAEFIEKALAASSKDKVRTTTELPENFVRKVPKGGWRDELSKGDLGTIEYLAGDLMEKLGYERALPKAKLKPLGLTLRDLPEPLLAFLKTRLGRATQLAHWAYVGRKTEWDNP